jgi:membrane protein YqaA with SNARE-associated domain
MCDGSTTNGSVRLLYGVEQFFIGLASQLGLASVLILSFLGASSILFPIPYHPFIFLIGLNAEQPLLVVIFAGVGAAVGELTGYVLGYVAEKAVGEKRKRRFEALLKILMRHRRVWPLLIFFFALTPLPDDLLFIPLGLVRFHFLRAFIPCLLGKLAMFSILVYGGRYFGEIVLSFFGGETEMSTVAIILAAIFLVVIVVGMWKIDFEKLLIKYEGLMNRRK